MCLAQVAGQDVPCSGSRSICAFAQVAGQDVPCSGSKSGCDFSQVAGQDVPCSGSRSGSLRINVHLFLDNRFQCRCSQLYFLAL